MAEDVDIAATTDGCDGSFACPVVRHVHGCFADVGNCDDPGDHYRIPPASTEEADRAENEDHS